MAPLHVLRNRRGEQGFTLLELMVVVVIIAILAAVVVPSFIGESKKVKAKTEVNAVFAELGAKEERYKNENNVYLAVATCPATPSQTPQAITACKAAADWLALGLLAPEDNLRCSYEVVVGTNADDPATMIPAGATYTPPTGCCATGWYMLHATCNMDGDAVMSHYMVASFDGTMQYTAEGE